MSEAITIDRDQWARFFDELARHPRDPRLRSPLNGLDEPARRASALRPPSTQEGGRRPTPSCAIPERLAALG